MTFKLDENLRRELLIDTRSPNTRRWRVSYCTVMPIGSAILRIPPAS